MNSRYSGLFGLAALGLAWAGSVQAAPAFMEGEFVVAQRDRGEDVRQDPRDIRRNERGARREEPRGYGYGYERRHQREREEERAEDPRRPREAR